MTFPLGSDHPYHWIGHNNLTLSMCNVENKNVDTANVKENNANVKKKRCCIANVEKKQCGTSNVKENDANVDTNVEMANAQNTSHFRIPHPFVAAISNTKHLRARTEIPQYSACCTSTPQHVTVICFNVPVNVVNMPVNI